MTAAEGVTEAFKAADQMEWIRRTNSIRNRAGELVESELIYKLNKTQSAGQNGRLYSGFSLGQNSAVSV